MKIVIVEGKKYEVIKDLGYTREIGAYGKKVKTEQGERIVISYSRRSPWGWRDPT